LQPRQILKSGAVVLVVALAALLASESVRILALDGGSPTAAGNPLFVPAFVLSLIGTTLFVASFPVTYVRQAVQAGKTGLVGLVAYIGGGLVFGYGVAAINAVIAPFMYADPKLRPFLQSGHGPEGFIPLVLIGTVLFTVGNLCYGIATLRARIYPRAIGFSLILAAVLEVLGTVTSAANLNLPGWTDLLTDAASFGAIAAMAIWLLREARTDVVHEAERPAPLREATVSTP
jgi:hypothetical protein